MGGPCLQYVRSPHGEHEQRLCPPCTNNFQVVPGGFEYDGITWHSVEQAFQSLKFPRGASLSSRSNEQLLDQTRVMRITV